MRTIKILSLEMENFKGCAHRRLELDGRGITICGENGCGKTTHYDAVCWVLFGKDSHGNTPGERSDFQIKPHGLRGKMPTVTLTLEVDGAAVTLKKVYRERWEKQRGSPDARFAGNTTECWIDGTPKKESDYRAYIAAIAPEETWRLLTDVYWFCRDMPWRERRAMLFDLCAVRGDAELLAEKPEFAPLQAALGRQTLDECRARLRSDRAKANKALEALPIRIDECSRSAADFAGLDFAALRMELDRKTAERDAAQAKLAEIVHDAAIEKASLRWERAQNALAALENENTAYRQAQTARQEDPRAALLREKSQALRALDGQAQTREREQAAAATAETRLQSYQTRLDAIAQEEWTYDPICPHCGQQMPENKLEEARAAFQANRAAREKTLREDAELIRSDLAARQARLAALDRELTALRAQFGEITLKLEALPAVEKAEPVDLPDYGDRKAALCSELDAAESELHRLRTDRASLENGLRGQAAALERELDTIRTQLAKEKLLEQARARMEQYEAERQTVRAEVERIDRLLYLSDEFTRYKSERITEAVNGLFDTLRFRLFTPQVNGGLAECCDALLDGKPYGTVSDGEKVKLGLDAICGLSRALGLCVPLFIDGAESVTGLPKMPMQTVRMAVREGEKQLLMLYKT